MSFWKSILTSLTDGLDFDWADFSFNGYTLDIACRDKGEVITSKRTGRGLSDAKLH